MKDWDVRLIFVEGNSSKFWRARTEGARLFVNFGRIGSDGQTQIKDLGSEAQAQRELEKVAASKRKKGYSEEDAEAPATEEDEDEEAGDEETEEEDSAPRAKAKAPPKPPTAQRQVADLELSAQGRKIEVRLEQEGTRLRTVVVEHYDSAKKATEAFGRISTAMADEGYHKASRTGEL